jgi:hypothetical protein
MEIHRINNNILLCNLQYYTNYSNHLFNFKIINTTNQNIVGNNIYTIKKKDLQKTTEIINFIKYLSKYNIIIIKDNDNNNLAFKFIILYFVINYNLRINTIVNMLSSNKNFNSYINDSIKKYEFILFDKFNFLPSSCNKSVPIDID